MIALLCLATLAAAATLRIDGDEVFVPVVDVAMPIVCWSRRIFDVHCPGCGLTRSAVSAMHGDLAAAWRWNPAAFVLLPLLAHQLIFRLVQLRRIRASRAPLVRNAGTWMLGLLLVAMLAQWLLRR